MYAPVFLPPAPATSPAVRAFERAVLAAEGRHHVAGRYFASGADADRFRRLEAERFEREAARLVASAAPRAAAEADRQDSRRATGRAA
jgi:hypothetical protein